MGRANKKQKPKGFFEEVAAAFSSSKEAKADKTSPYRPKGDDDSGASIAERINFGGRGKSMKKKRLDRSKRRK